MATPRKRHAQKSGRKNTRRTAEKRKRGNAIIKANWDKKQTLVQNYKRLGLLTTLNGTAGGREKLIPEKKPQEDAMDQDSEELPELKEADIEELKKTLKPGEGLIQRDDEGNVIRVIVGEARTHNDILDAEPEPVPAKTDVVRALEAQAMSGVKHEKYMSNYQIDWIEKLIEKHGDDYRAMFWDKELNTLQLTEAQLRKKIKQYLKEQQQ
ncbi:ribosome biogenesis protein Nop16 [Dichotomocladium elegans]|nr:ribosome biogenesis protein Nop16 [Dichotomocladium elegans]